MLPARGQPGGLPLTFPGDREDVVATGQRDAEVVVLGEAAAVQHVGPGEAEGGHHRGAALLHLLAERVAGLDDLVQVVDADGGEEGAEELPGVGVALLLHQRDPGGGLLQHLLHRLMPQQVGQPHALVLDAPAQQHRGGDGLAVGALVGEVGLPEGEEPGGRGHALGRQQEQGAEAALHFGARRKWWWGVGERLGGPGWRGAERAARRCPQPQAASPSPGSCLPDGDGGSEQDAGANGSFLDFFVCKWQGERGLGGAW